MNHFVSMQQLSEYELLQLVKKADGISKSGMKPLKEQYFGANLFYEPSTRTKMSFIVAQKKLGIEVLDFMSDQSSVKKGESLYDTARTFESIGASFIVIRHPAENVAKQLADQLSIPVINAGDGTGEHPTQSLLDLVTIYQEFQRLSGLKIAIVGDVKHSRVARSNAIALNKLGANVVLCSMDDWKDESLPFPYLSIDEAVETCDVVMLLRIQHERHDQKTLMHTSSYLKEYGLTLEREKKMKDHAIIMHPAPVNRGVEIDSALVECEKSRIFKQMKNGVAARMAVISSLLEQGGKYNENHFNKRNAIIGQ
ncbi:aspartate carbamoyltransferase catalytic subunit [Saliterribacillus persicus]|uniref:Aspartate carbamoyltransferase n=1 Tax=Saliterribacillus persicus TaxID=930114 RepID=A0A368XTG2_9BACI|nr:aspartate carbamoyltransferase catalytic subunit [Saliterribacillus persicus]RCW70779.1 aspartate carbamoyltransferase [Saliterribacillus persicus]